MQEIYLKKSQKHAKGKFSLGQLTATLGNIGQHTATLGNLRQHRTQHRATGNMGQHRATYGNIGELTAT